MIYTGMAKDLDVPLLSLTLGIYAGSVVNPGLVGFYHDDVDTHLHKTMLNAEMFDDETEIFHSSVGYVRSGLVGVTGKHSSNFWGKRRQICGSR